MILQGTISDSKGTILKNVTVATINLQTGENYYGDSIFPDGNYTIDMEYPPGENDAFKISKDGFETIYIYLKDLVLMPNIVLQKQFPYWMIVLVLSAYFLYTKKSGKVGKMNTDDIKNIFLIIGGVLGIALIKQIMDKLGLGADPGADDSVNLGSAWNPTYWQQFNNFTYVINEATALNYAKTIHDAFTVFQDDYNRIASVFRLLRTKANVSYLSFVFNNYYQEDLLSFLKDGGGVLPWDGLSQTHLQELVTLVNNLPKN